MTKGQTVYHVAHCYSEPKECVFEGYGSARSTLIVSMNGQSGYRILSREIHANKIQAFKTLCRIKDKEIQDKLRELNRLKHERGEIEKRMIEAEKEAKV